MSLDDCNLHGPDIVNELIVVEGASAAANVRRGRNVDKQAVLALQGKPVNAVKAGRRRIEQSKELGALARAMGCGMYEQFKLQNLRYKQIVLLFDPDADGIHCGALVQIFLHQCMPELIDTQKIILVRPPLYEITLSGRHKPVYAYSGDHYTKICSEIEKQGIKKDHITRFKGVASLGVPLLQRICLQSATRREKNLTMSDVERAVDVFGV